MRDWAAVGRRAIDGVFARFGAPGLYTPEGGPAVGCSVIPAWSDHADGLRGLTGNRVEKDAVVIRRAQVALPAKGAALVLYEADGVTVKSSHTVLSFREAGVREAWILVLRQDAA